MKKLVLKIALSFVIATSFCLNIVYGQRAKQHDFTFFYTQLPATPLADNIETYSPKVEVSYIDQINQMEEEYAREVKRAEERYQKDLEAYNKQSTLGKIVSQEILDQEKPVYVAPERPFIPEVPNTDVLRDKYVVLEGYKKGTTNPVFITVTLHLVTVDPPEYSTKTSSKTVDGKKVTETTDIYKVTYSQPIHMKIESGLDGKVYFDKIVPGTERQFTRTYTKSLPDGYAEKLAENVLAMNMNRMNAYLNDNFGLRKKSLHTDISYGVHRKFNYSDYQKALEHALSGYNLLYADKESAKKKLGAAVDIWINALKEFNPNKRRTRVNEKVGVATMLNIAEASLFMDQFDRAEQYFTKAEINDPSNGQERKIAVLRNIMRERRKRYEANQ